MMDPLTNFIILDNQDISGKTRSKSDEYINLTLPLLELKIINQESEHINSRKNRFDSTSKSEDGKNYGRKNQQRKLSILDYSERRQLCHKLQQIQIKKLDAKYEAKQKQKEQQIKNRIHTKQIFEKPISTKNVIKNKKLTFSQRFGKDDYESEPELFQNIKSEHLSGSLDTSQKLQTKIKQTEQQLRRLMDSDSDLYRSQSPVTKLCEKLNLLQNVTQKHQKVEQYPEVQPPILPLPSKSSEFSAYDPTSFDTSNPLSQNPFSNNWRDYDSSNFQRQSNYVFNSTPSFSDNPSLIYNFQNIELEKTQKDQNKVVELIQKIYKVLIEINKAANSQNKDYNLSMLLSSYSSTDLENLVKSPQGSKLMQDVLNKHCKKDLLQIIMDNLIMQNDTMQRLMTSKYSNYFVQLLMTKICSHHKKQIIMKILGDVKGHTIFVKSSLNSIGTHCLQKFIEQIKSEPEMIILIIKQFVKIQDFQVQLLITNQNSCYVVKKIFSLIFPIDFRKNVELQEQANNLLRNYLRILEETEKDYFKETCNHQYGVIILKQIVQILNKSRMQGKSETYSEFVEIKNKYYSHIVDNFLSLSQNCFGNYIIQEILEQPQNCQLQSTLQDRISIIIVKNLYSLSLQKYSSNVVDKCIFKLSKPVIANLIQQICSVLSPQQFGDLIMNDYANFAVKNLFTRNKQIKNVQFLNLVDESLEIIQNNIKAKNQKQSQPTQKLLSKWKNYVSQQRKNIKSALIQKN